MKYLITGFPGVGKTSTATELSRRGYLAFDTEAMPGYMHTQSRLDGTIIDKPAVVPAGWYDTVGAFNWNIAMIESLLELDGPIFVCAKAHNQDQLLNRFNNIFILTANESELKKRLANRPGNTLGKAPEELTDILTLRGAFEDALMAKGAIEIDTSHKSLDEVVDIILGYT